MSPVLTAVACTADPLLDICLAQCKEFQLVAEVYETLEGALRAVAAHKPALLFTSPAFGGIEQLCHSVKGLRVCCLAAQEEDAAPAPAINGLDVLQAPAFTPELIDAWVRSRRQPVRAEAPTKAPPLAEASPPAETAAQTPPQSQAPPPAQPQAPAPGPAQRTLIPPPPPLPATPQPIRAEAPAVAPPAAEPPPIRAAAPQAPPPTRTVPGHSASAGPSRLAATPRARTAAPVAPVVSVLRQQVVALWGGKPGAGRSTLALALSDLISQVGAVKVCTVDLNPVNSSLAPLLGKDQELPSWVHLAEGLAQGRLNLAEGLRWVRSNWAIISGAGGRDEWSALLTPANLGLLVDGLRSQFDYIILDTEARAGALSDAALRLAQTALLVVSPDYPDVVDSAKAFQGAVERGVIDRTRTRLVLSRWIDTQHLPAEVVAECFELPVSARIPCSYEAVISAAGQGVPVTQLEHPGAKVLLPAFRAVVQLVAGQLGHTATAERSSLGASLRGLFGRA